MSALLPPARPFDTLARLATQEIPPEAEFLRRFPEPVLLVPASALAPSDFDATATGSFEATPPSGIYATQAGGQSPVVTAFNDFREAAIVPVRKTERNSFTQMVTVGRADNNDVVLSSATVSKLHAYFIKDSEGRLRFQDAGSTNGLWVNGERIPPRGAVHLEDGADVLLSGDVRVLFKTPRGLFQILRYVQMRLSR